MMKPRLVALFMVLPLGSGCGRTGIGSVGSSAAAADFCHSMIDEVVAAGARCAAGSDFPWRDQYTGSVPCDQVDGLLAAGTLTYDPATGADCLTRLSQMDCVGEVLPEPCRDAIAGRLPAGSQCSFFANSWFSDCAPGNYCHRPGNACGGTCQPYVQPGGSCAYTDAGGFPLCASGSSCNNELCVPYLGDGEICWGEHSAGDCGDGLYCDFRTTNPAICRKRRTSGTCADGFECAAGTVCAGPANAKTCTKVKLPGDSCTQGQSECFGLSFCGDGGKCTRTGVAENQPCGTNLQGEYIQCGIDFFCAGTLTLVDPSVGTVGGVGTCQEKKPMGSNCSYWTECAGNLAYCDSATRLCVACN
jgi:hypothetical protein